MIVACGEALVDLVPGPDVPVPVPGGGPMNVAVSAARLGVPSAFVGRISTDDYGQMITSHLEANGVDLRAVERGSEPTARAIVEHTPQLVFRFEGDDTADMNLEAANLAALVQSSEGSGEERRIVHGGTLGLFRGRTASVLAELVEGHGGLVSLDPNVRPQIIDDRARWDHFHDRWLARTHIYKVSDEDLEWIQPGRRPHSFAEELLAGAAEVVFVTRGGDGVAVYTSAGALDVAADPVQVVDTVGAGDTFVATVLASLWELGASDPGALASFSLETWKVVTSRAAAAAAITCTRPGADPPVADELPELSAD